MKLYELNIFYNRVITNEALRCLTTLRTLDISYNENITNYGLENLMLYSLDVSGYPNKITCEGIAHMDLHILNRDHNKNMEDYGITQGELSLLNCLLTQ
jgi:hypothetical protein